MAFLLVISISASFALTAGDYRSVGSGDWDVAGTWARYNGSAWITSPAEGWPGQNVGTGAVTIISGMNVNINSLSTKTLGTVTIDGILTINTNENPILNTQLLIVTPTIGKIDFGSKAKITLPANAALNVTIGGLSGTCTNNNEIIIGTITYSYCKGGGADHVTFTEVEDQGGTGVFGSNSPICLGDIINLWASPPPLVHGIITYAWSGPGGWNSPSPNNTSRASATVAMNGQYKVIMTGKDGIGNVLTVTRTLEVTVSPSPTIANAGPDQAGAATCGLTTITLAANAPTVGTGAWTILTGAGGTVNTPTSPTSILTGTAGTAYTLRWTISANCAVSTDDVNITFNTNTIHLNSPGTDAQSICINTPITDITYAVGGGATGATVSVLPAGISGNYNSGVYTISGTPTVSGTFNYTVTTTGGTCANATATGTITINPIPVMPTVAVADNCDGTFTLTASACTGALLWSNGAIVTPITVAAGTYTVTQTLNGCTSLTCSCTATTETIPPTFLIDPPSNPFCVESIQQATYDPTDINIIPADRPDFYILKAHDTDLDLNPLIYFDDNCTPKNNLFLHWSITNSLNQPIKDINGLSLDDMVGQVSSYTNAADIIFPGAANADVTYTITYWLKDLNGNTSITKTANITIKPRPKFL